MTTYRSSNAARYAAKFSFFAASLVFGVSVAQGQVIDNFHGNTPAVAAYHSAPAATFEARRAQARVVGRGRGARAEVRSTLPRNVQIRTASAGSYYIDQDPDIHVRSMVQKDFAHQ